MCGTQFIGVCVCALQKRILLQVPEQREAAESEIRIHRLVDHENVVKLVSAEVKDQRNGEGVALLLFPYYQVRLLCMEIELLQLYQQMDAPTRRGGRSQ
jgi:hypothetical protein